jgi:hypothetical protein
VVGCGLAGGAVATLVVSLTADDRGRRGTLAILAGLTAVGGWGIALGQDLLFLALAAFLGMANGMGRDRAAAFSLEQAILPSTTTPERRTGAFAVYSLVLDLGHAAGNLAAGLPWLLREWGMAEGTSYRAALAGAASLNLVSLLLYVRLTSAVEVAVRRTGPRLSPRSRRIVSRFAAISAIDSLGGGLLAGSLVSAWFLTRFGVDEHALAPLFVAGRAANMVSYGLAVWLARRIGLVNTMVFTHLPAHLLLVAMAFAPSLPVVVGIYLLRELLVEMDVPTRTAFITSVVEPGERTVATGVTNVSRVSAWAIGPFVGGATMAGVALFVPFVAAAAVKVTYDLLLWRFGKRVSDTIFSSSSSS